MEATTEAKTGAPSLDAPQPSNLAAPSRGTTHVSPWQPVDWTKERTELMRKQLCPPTATELEFEFYLDWCKQTGLNPFLKQSFLIERGSYQRNPRGGEDIWVTKHDPFVAEAGFAARADTLPDFRGMKSGVVYEGDIFGIDENAGIVVHEWDLKSRKAGGNKVLGAWAQGFRDGRVCEITWVTIESRIQLKKDKTPTKFWKDDAPGQIRKCARADQYRHLYPNIFGNWYDPAEARDDERELNDPPASAAPPTTPTSKSEALAARLKKQAQTVDAAPTSKAPDAKASPPAAAAGKKSTAPAIDELRFGPLKGKKIVDCSTIELTEALKIAHEQLALSTGKESWLKNVKDGVDAVDREIDLREKGGDVSESAEDTGPSESAPEPGSGG